MKQDLSTEAVEAGGCAPPVLASPAKAPLEDAARQIFCVVWNAGFADFVCYEHNSAMWLEAARCAIAAAPSGVATPSIPASEAARAWLHSYGTATEPYTRGGRDHPAMHTLPAAFEVFAASREAAPPVMAGAVTGLQSVHDYVQEYELRDPDYTPDQRERLLIEDAIEGYLGTMQEAGLIGYRDGKTTAALSVAPGRADAETRKVIIGAFKESCEFHGAYDVAGIILRACTAIDAALPPIAGERQS